VSTDSHITWWRTRQVYQASMVTWSRKPLHNAPTTRRRKQFGKTPTTVTQLIVGSPLFSLDLSTYCIRHNWPHYSHQSSHFQFMASRVPLTAGLSPISPTGLPRRHFRLLFLFQITFILWCSSRLCLRSYPFHNVCLTYCFNCILSRCQSIAICWRYTAFYLPFPFIFI